MNIMLRTCTDGSTGDFCRKRSRFLHLNSSLALHQARMTEQIWTTIRKFVVVTYVVFGYAYGLVPVQLHVLTKNLFTQNVTKGQVAACVKDGADTLNTVKQKTKAGTGCGGCMWCYFIVS